ncbi:MULTISPECIES: stage III sporulation protein AC [Tissierellales]|jgi:stage III sporulation protein AC|uniref:Stage III sporulation protein AC n=1 Tax=Acidilutibacter cellobiosedens TaxID=2507161 RepID=A0A410QCM1_9FIRM|nr:MULTISPECIES: stage III sporulation protein AC [Tissierellales]MBE6082587.1 stage III sporulation protein AC [Tissierellaceae bacterium]QAT61773.1 stage III sporulation protein AC [Acidilutibacter cellobiosedens]SCL82314.1 stage III sporulation protein AC [Sporanaerobacter sp. PP17-6a]
MNVDLIFKIASIGILSAVLHTLLERAGKEEYAYLATLAGVIIVLGVVINLISKLFENVKSLFQLY